MATFSRIKVKTQSAGRMLGALGYAMQGKKTMFEGQWLVSGNNCVPRTCYLEMMATKQQHKKGDGVQFYSFVQSFHQDEAITPQQANQIALELADKLFPDYESVVATHVDTDNVHSHIIVNSVSYKHGKKLHLSPTSIEEMREVNDQICMTNGLSVLEPYTKKGKKKAIKPSEFRSATRGNSWKFALIYAIDEALRYSVDQNSFMQNMAYEGYEVIWKDTRKYITFITPEGHRCRDSNLHDETYLKENLEKLFAYRQEHGFIPDSPEPQVGWLLDMENHIYSDVVKLGKDMERLSDGPPAWVPPAFTESKQKRREALKKLAQGQKLGGQQEHNHEPNL